MTKSMKRIEKESKELLEHLGGHEVNPLEVEDKKENEQRYRRYHQRKKSRHSSPEDPFDVISVRIRKSRKEALRELSEKEQLLMTDLLDEAIADLLHKYDIDFLEQYGNAEEENSGAPR